MNPFYSKTSLHELLGFYFLCDSNTPIQSQVDHYSLLKVLSIYFTLANILLCNAFSYESFYYVIFILRIELLVFNI